MLKIWAALLLFASALPGQHILYNQKQDQTAQDAVTAAKQITSGAVFDTMVANLNMQAKAETDTALAYTREIERAVLVSIKVWSPSDQHKDTFIAGVPICVSLRCKLDKLEKDLNAGSLLDSPSDAKNAAQRLEEIKNKETALQTAIENLKAAKPNQPEVLELLSHLGDVKDLVGYATTINNAVGSNKGVGNSLNAINTGLSQMISLYNSVKSIWDGEQAVKVNPASLGPSPEVIELQVLKLEEQDIENLTRIRAAEHMEAGDVLNEITSARQFLQDQLNSPDTIDETLRTAVDKAAASTEAAAKAGPSAQAVAANDRDHLRLILQGLFEASAALATNDAPVRLEEIREGEEYRLFNIRRNAVNSSSYDQAIQAAVQRLATYYKSGIKPSDLAALIFYITNSVAIPAIAAK